MCQSEVMFCALTSTASSYIRASKDPWLLYDQKKCLKIKAQY